MAVLLPQTLRTRYILLFVANKKILKLSFCTKAVIIYGVSV